MLRPHTDLRPPPGSQIPAAARCGLALALVVFIVLLPRHVGVLYLVPAVLILLLWLGLRMPFLPTLRRLLIAEFFIIGLVLLYFLRPSSGPLVLATALKSNLCVLTMILLTWTTPFYEILQVLRRVQVPPLMLTTLALMYRYIPVLAEESTRMRRARASRTFSAGRTLAWDTAASIIGQLFLRCASRAERIYLAMCSRGWK